MSVNSSELFDKGYFKSTSLGVGDGKGRSKLLDCGCRLWMQELMVQLQKRHSRRTGLRTQPRKADGRGICASFERGLIGADFLLTQCLLLSSGGRGPALGIWAGSYFESSSTLKSQKGTAQPSVPTLGQPLHPLLGVLTAHQRSPAV